MLTDTEYLVRLHVVLEPVGQPWVNIDVGGQHSGQQLLAQQKFDFEFTARHTCDLKITHFAKSDLDPFTAVIVKEIGFFSIVDPRFVWAGIYVPDYPEHYPIKTTPLPGQTYLGWNGVYELNFSVPVFSWMHKILNMGWLYD